MTINRAIIWLLFFMSSMFCLCRVKCLFNIWKLVVTEFLSCACLCHTYRKCRRGFRTPCSIYVMERRKYEKTMYSPGPKLPSCGLPRHIPRTFVAHPSALWWPVLFCRKEVKTVTFGGRKRRQSLDSWAFRNSYRREPLLLRRCVAAPQSPDVYISSANNGWKKKL